MSTITETRPSAKCNGQTLHEGDLMRGVASGRLYILHGIGHAAAQLLSDDGRVRIVRLDRLGDGYVKVEGAAK